MSITVGHLWREEHSTCFCYHVTKLCTRVTITPEQVLCIKEGYSQKLQKKLVSGHWVWNILQKYYTVFTVFPLFHKLQWILCKCRKFFKKTFQICAIFFLFLALLLFFTFVTDLNNSCTQSWVAWKALKNIIFCYL